MKRKFYDTLLSWKSESKKPLMVIGARQIGKTYIINQFCKAEYENYIYLNFDKDDTLSELFENSKDPNVIIKKLELFLNKDIDIGNTIIFFDEIQLCERAINSLKYFCESDTKYNIICAGSLLGVKLNRYESSFPVGKVKIIHMHPMDFEEFLWANHEEKLTDEIKNCYQNNTSMMEIFHNKAIELYRTYLCTGGMPASISEYIESNKILLFNGNEKEDIITSYIADMTKYTSSTEALKVHEIYKNLPKQLGKENKKFQYQLINPYARTRNYSTPLEWLIESEIVLKCSLVTTPQIPLEAYKEENYFKIYFNDVGLFATHAKIPLVSIIEDSNMIYKGAIAENYVAQTLVANGYQLYYTRLKNSLEIDFLITVGNEVIPIEVKASTNTKSSSLNNYIKQYKPNYSIRLSLKNFGFENNIKSIPLYAAFCI